jgi:RNA polymerase sigma factor (sigma-70 family)
LTPKQRERVAESLPFVYALARVLAWRLRFAEDLLRAAGEDALLELVVRYDDAQGDFQGFVYRRVRGAMFDACRSSLDPAVARLRKLGALDVSDPDDHETNEATVEDLVSEAATPLRAHAVASIRDRVAALTAHAIADVDRGAEELLIKRQELGGALALLNRLLEGLTQRERDVLRAIYWDDKTLDQIADEMGVDRKTVWRGHGRVKKQMHASLLEAGLHEPPVGG